MQNRRHITTLTTLALIFGLLSGCAGEFEISSTSDATIADTKIPKRNSDGTIQREDEEAEEEIEVLPPAFELNRENVQLLPYHVRMNKLTQVTGLSTDDPAFDALKRNRYALGDHNYGQGIGADLSWSASKMSTWVESLEPVCASAAMSERYPQLPEQINELMLAAYGREAQEEDLALVEDTLTEIDMADVETRYRAVCLSVLSTVEFVGR